MVSNSKQKEIVAKIMNEIEIMDEKEFAQVGKAAQGQNSAGFIRRPELCLSGTLWRQFDYWSVELSGSIDFVPVDGCRCGRELCRDQTVGIYPAYLQSIKAND